MKTKAIGISGLLGVGILTCGLLESTATAAGTNDHFASRRAVAQAQQQQQQNLRSWGGPTTGRNWWTPQRGTNYRVVVPPVVPRYVQPYYPGVYPGYPVYYPNYAAPIYYPRHYIHIERRLR